MQPLYSLRLSAWFQYNGASGKASFQKCRLKSYQIPAWLFYAKIDEVTGKQLCKLFAATATYRITGKSVAKHWQVALRYPTLGDQTSLRDVQIEKI